MKLVVPSLQIMLPVIPTPVFVPHAGDASAEAFRQRFPTQKAYIEARLKVPPPGEIYAVNEARMARRPRFFFGDMTVEDLRRRANDPRFADVVARVHSVAARFVGSTPPRTMSRTGHDPQRAIADSLPWMAMSALLEEDPERRQRTLESLMTWINAIRGWGHSHCDLVIVQLIISLSLVYDWLHDVLPAADLAAIRDDLIASNRYTYNEDIGSFTMWRGQRYASNHYWADHSSHVFAALALWGDEKAPLGPDELRSWLDEGMQNMWIVSQLHAADGAPVEGPCYQNYGLRFYVDFITQTESLLHLRKSFFDEHMRALSARLFMMLPGLKGAMNFSDGFTFQWWDFSSHFRGLAKHFRDPRLQLMGDLFANSEDSRSLTSWRELFAWDPDLHAARIEDLPLTCDLRDFGLYTARSGWDREAAFFGLRCGPASAESVMEKVGYDFGEGHVYPNQGDFTFFVWSREIIPGCDYPPKKVTSNHNLVVFEGRDTQAGKLVGQLGEGGAWFNSAAPTDPDSDYDKRDRITRVVALEHGDGFHHYLCDLGGLYRLRDEGVPGGFFFADYWRSIVFLTDGAVAVVDRVRLPVERTFSFRLLTVMETLETDEDGFTFALWGAPGRINDFSPTKFERAATTEMLPSYETPRRFVASLRAVEKREAVFAVVLGVGPAASRYRIVTNERGYTITDGSRTILSPDWSTFSRL